MARKPAKQVEITPGARIVVYAGKDAFLRAEHTASLRELLEKAHGEVDVIRFDGSATEAADVLDECRSFGLMQQHKLVVVDEADQFVKESTRQLVERYAEAPCEGATLALRCEKWHKGKLDKLIEDPGKGAGAIVRCDAPTEVQAAAWAIKRSKKRHDAELGREAAQQLVSRLGADLGRIDAELGKLSAASGGEEITKALVVEFVGISREEEVWGIQAELLRAGPERVLMHLRELIDVSRQPTVLISYAFIDLARKLHAACAGLEAGQAPDQIAKALKLWGPSKEAIMASARKMRPTQTMRLLDAAVAADVAQKSGLGRPELQLERVALRFAGAV